jgi:hypothetical protein
MSNILPEYRMACRKQGISGMKKADLIGHMKKLPAFLGSVKSYRIGEKNTSCYAFNYKQLGVQLDGVDIQDDEDLTNEPPF